MYSEHLKEIKKVREFLTRRLEMKAAAIWSGEFQNLSRKYSDLAYGKDGGECLVNLGRQGWVHLKISIKEIEMSEVDWKIHLDEIKVKKIKFAEKIKSKERLLVELKIIQDQLKEYESEFFYLGI